MGSISGDTAARMATVASDARDGGAKRLRMAATAEAPSGAHPPETEIGRLWRKRSRLQDAINAAPSGLTEEAFASLVETRLNLDRRLARAEAVTVEDMACKVLVAVASLETDGDCAGAFLRLAAPRSLLADAERIVRARR